MIGQEDFEAVRNLKADYFRHLDAKRWSNLRHLFHVDATFGGFPFSTENADDFISGVSSFLDDVDSVHQGFMPRLAVAGEDCIRGIWTMHDYLIWPCDSRDYRGASIPGLYGIRGYGFYEEEYRLLNGRWRIATMRLVRTRIDLLVGEPVHRPMDSLISPDPDWIPNA
jgi:hypothetical protein